MTSDPIGLAGGLNSYGYVGNRPYEFIDPLGLATLCDAMYFLADNYQSNPFLNGSRFDKNLVSTEVIPPGGSKQDTSVFTDHRNNLTYDVQYVQIAWSLTKTYGPGSPTLAMNGYQIAPLIYAIKDGDWSWFKPSNLSANHRGLQLGEFGAKRFVLFPDFVHDLCPRECRP